MPGSANTRVITCALFVCCGLAVSLSTPTADNAPTGIRRPRANLSQLIPGKTYSRCAISGVIAIGIDDGGAESEFGPTLDRLKEARIPATFFHVCRYLQMNPARIALVKRALEEGHSIQVGIVPPRTRSRRRAQVLSPAAPHLEPPRHDKSFH